MNRPIKPTIEKYTTLNDFLIDSEKYQEDLEEYCNELEKELEQYELSIKHEDDPYKYMSFGEMRMHSWNN